MIVVAVVRLAMQVRVEGLNSQLAIAINGRDPWAVKSLLDLGADANATERDGGSTALRDVLRVFTRERFRRPKQRRMLELAVNRMMEAKRRDDFDRGARIVELLCWKGADAARCFSNGYSPLVERFDPHLCEGYTFNVDPTA